MDDKLRVEAYIEPLSTISTVQKDTTIGSALGGSVTTHESVLVYGGDAFLGIVSPYQLLYKNKYPKDAKVKDALVHPPHITRDTHVSKVVDQMMALRVYTLPVFDGGQNPVGVVHASHIVADLVKNQDIQQMIAEHIVVNDPITIQQGSLVKDAHSMLRKEKIARLIVVDEHGKLTGIITRGDLGDAFLHPTPKQRASGSARAAAHMMFMDEKVKRKDTPITPFVSTRVFTLPSGTSANEVLVTMMDKGYSSIVFVGDDKKPVGFLSLRDVLRAVSALRMKESVSVQMRLPEGMTERVRHDVAERIERFGVKIRKRVEYSHLDVVIDQTKRTKGRPLHHSAQIQIVGMPGPDLRASAEHERAITAIGDAIRKLERQLRD